MCVVKCVRFVVGKLARMTSGFSWFKDDEVYICILNNEG
jgi:hypothetical protein